MDVLTSTPFSLSLDTLIKVRASAINTVGTSITSFVNSNGAKVRTIPT